MVGKDEIYGMEPGDTKTLADEMSVLECCGDE